MKRKNGMSDHDAKQLKNDSYRTNQVTFMIDHSHKGNGNFNTTTSCNGNKLITVITCNACDVSRTFYFNL